MRVTVLVVVVALALIFDQLKSGGYYRSSLTYAVEQGTARIIRLFYR